MAYFLGGTSILIVVSVALDLVDKLNSALLMRNHDGFMRTGGARRGLGGRRDGGRCTRSSSVRPAPARAPRLRGVSPRRIDLVHL